jgi:nicotinate-nucleotide adenylyltransferase
VEIDRGGPSYAIETVRYFHETFPGAELFWLIGADQLPKLSQWEQARELKRLVTFVVLARRGYPVRRRPGLFPLTRRRSFDLAATEVRFRVRENLPISWLTPEPVVRYIHKNQLYRR